MSGTSQLGSRVLDLLSASAPTVFTVGNTSNSGNMLLYDANTPANGYLIQSSNSLFSISGNTGVTNTFVGIGTTAPTSTLHVQGNAQITGTLTASNLGITGTTTIINSTIINTSNIAVNNQGSGPALSVIQQQNTAQPVAQFMAGSTNALYIDNRGDVGINTTNPLTLLSISSNVVSGIGPILSINNTGGFLNSSSVLEFNTYTGSGTGNTYPAGAQIRGIDDGNYGADLAFYTKQTGSYPAPLTERIRIDSTGNVGIGTTNPISPLHVYGSNIGTTATIENALNGQSFSLLRLYTGSGTALNLFKNSPSRTADGGSDTATLRNDAGALRLNTNAAGTTGITITGSATGLVGIATTNPQFQLDVNGFVRSTGYIGTYNTFYDSGGSTGWVNLGLFDGTVSNGNGCSIELILHGQQGYGNYSQNGSESGGKTTIFGRMGNNANTGFANMDLTYTHIGSPLPCISGALAIQVGASRTQYNIWINQATYTRHTITYITTVNSTFTPSASYVFGTPSGTTNSATVRVATPSSIVAGNTGFRVWTFSGTHGSQNVVQNIAATALTGLTILSITGVTINSGDAVPFTDTSAASQWFVICFFRGSDNSLQVTPTGTAAPSKPFRITVITT